MSERKVEYQRCIYVIEMADDQFGWVICNTALNTRLSEARKSLAEVKSGWPRHKFRIKRYEAVQP